MNTTNRVHLAPALVTPDELAGRTVLVIDLLRASTTICYALANGATAVVPYAEVDEVRLAAAEARLRGEDILCGGERGGRRIEGFDLGNSPREYAPAVVAGRRVLFTTTNGTRALYHARLAERIIVASLANLSAVAHVVAGKAGVDMLCAGSDGSVVLEDIVAAGAFVAHVARVAGDSMTDAARVAFDVWLRTNGGVVYATPDRTERLVLSLTAGDHARHLISLGFEEDLTLCATVDALDVVPVFDPRRGSIAAS